MNSKSVNESLNIFDPKKCKYNDYVVEKSYLPKIKPLKFLLFREDKNTCIVQSENNTLRELIPDKLCIIPKEKLIKYFTNSINEINSCLLYTEKEIANTILEIKEEEKKISITNKKKDKIKQKLDEIITAIALLGEDNQDIQLQMDKAAFESERSNLANMIYEYKNRISVNQMHISIYSSKKEVFKEMQESVEKELNNLKLMEE